MNDIPISFSGTLTDEPKAYVSQGKTSVTFFSVAVNHRRYSQQTKRYEEYSTTFERCKAFGTLAEGIGASLHKGMRVMVIGSETTEMYTDRNTGEQKNTTFIQVSDAGMSVMFDARHADDQQTRRGSRELQSDEDPWAGIN